MQPPQNSQQALAALQGAQQSAQDPNSILQAQNQQLGVNDAQNTVTGLRGAINNTTKLLTQVAPSVMGRTANSLVTNAQATKQIGNEQAPIQANLTQEGTDYNQASEDEQKLQDQAQTAASGIYQGQQDKLSYAQNLYNSLYQSEQDAATRAEQQREFDAQQAAAAAASKQFNLNGGNPTPAAPAATMVKKSSGNGFNFTDKGGNAISAASYAAQTGTPIGTVLKQMGQAGDKYAQQAYNEIAANQEYYANNPNALKQEFSALFWGS